MQLFFCDGLPVSYPSPDSPDHSPQRTCTTQSPEASGEYPNQEGFYSPSPSLGRTETIHPACRRPSQPPDTISTGAQTYSVPYSAGSAPTMWPTPPATACDDLEDYTYHASPTSGSFGLPDYASSIRSSVDSPRSWPSPEAQHLAYQQSVWETPEPTTPYSMNIAMAMHGEDMQQQLLGSPYGNPTYSLNHMSTDSMAAEAPGITPDYVDSAMSDRGASPLPEGNLKHCYVLNEDKAAPPLDQGGNDSDEDDAGKGEEPYAKLIFKAFLSRANHAMTLQELYQWFRDNTEKVTPNSKGWQNSIRHNLSMNGAFVKRDRDPVPGGPVTGSGEPRRSTEWALEDSALVEGLKSTTRYRKKTPRTRGNAAPHRPVQGGNRVSARATSGRKGGITTSKTRAAAQRRQQYGDLLASHVVPSSYYQYSRHASMELPCSARGDPATPPEVPAGAILFEDAMHGLPTLQSGTGHGYYYGSHHPHHQHFQHSHAESASGPGSYRLEDVTGVYDSRPIPQSSGPVNLSQLAAQLPEQFSRLFTDDMGMNSTTQVGHLNYGWVGGNQYSA